MSPAEERGASSNGPRRRLRCLVLQPHSGQVHSHVEEGEGKREEDGRILLGFRTSIQQFSAAKKSYFYLDRTLSRNWRAESKIVKMRAKNLLFVRPILCSNSSVSDAATVKYRGVRVQPIYTCFLSFLQCRIGSVVLSSLIKRCRNRNQFFCIWVSGFPKEIV